MMVMKLRNEFVCFYDVKWERIAKERQMIYMCQGAQHTHTRDIGKWFWIWIDCFDWMWCEFCISFVYVSFCVFNFDSNRFGLIMFFCPILAVCDFVKVENWNETRQLIVECSSKVMRTKIQVNWRKMWNFCLWCLVLKPLNTCRWLRNIRFGLLYLCIAHAFRLLAFLCLFVLCDEWLRRAATINK